MGTIFCNNFLRRAFLNHFSYLKKRKDRGGVGERETVSEGGTGSKLPLG
jgi:hypothetical protein